MKNNYLLILGVFLTISLIGCQPTGEQANADKERASDSAVKAGKDLKEAAQTSADAVRDSATAASTAIAETTGEAAVKLDNAVDKTTDKAVEIKKDLSNSEYTQKVKDAYNEGKEQQQNPPTD